MAPAAENKYTLRSLHQEIDLFDRKLAHMAMYDATVAGPERDAAERKLNQKRDQLEKKARRMAADGVAFEESELPRSFRSKDTPVKAASDAAPVASEETAAPTEAPATGVAVTETRAERRHPSAFSGTALDGDRILEYMRDRKSK